MISKYQKIYTILFLSSLFLFLINFLVQGKIFFGYEDSLGLILKMGGIFWLGFLILLILIFFHYSNFKKIDENYVYLTFTILIIYLIGTPFFYEYIPRFPDTWSHSYLANEMFKTGKVINGIDSYEQYPGAFLFFGLLFQILPYYEIMLFFPLFIYVLGIIIIYLLFKTLINARISYLSSILYIFFNWTVEDNHLSPQFLMLFVYFVFMFILVKMLTDEKNKKKYSLFYLIMSPIIVFSHPGLPIFLFFILGSMLILCKKLRFTILAVFLFLGLCFIIHTVLFTTEIGSYTTYLENFIKSLSTGQFSQVTQSFKTSFAFREVFLYSRFGITLFSAIFGILGLIVMFKNKYSTGAKFLFSWAFSMMLFVIFVGIVLKGQFYERFALISSLPLAALTVYFLEETKIHVAYIFIIFLVITPVYFIAKYGNEAFESISLQKLRAICYYSTKNPDCYQKEIVDNKLIVGIDGLGKTSFVVSREDEIWNSVYLDKDLNMIIDSLKKLAVERKLNRIYSTDISVVYG